MGFMTGSEPVTLSRWVKLLFPLVVFANGTVLGARGATEDKCTPSILMFLLVPAMWHSNPMRR